MNAARNTTRQALKINFNLEIAENFMCYVLLYLCEKVQILSIAWAKEAKISGNKVSERFKKKNLEVRVTVSSAGLASNLIENETLAIK